MTAISGPAIRWCCTSFPRRSGEVPSAAARILVDRLDEPGVVRHRLLGLFDGPSEVEMDLSLRYPAGRRPAGGFQPRLALRLRRELARLDPTAVVAHGGDPMKYVLPAVVGTRRSLVYCVIGTYGDRRRHSTCGDGGTSWLERTWWSPSATKSAMSAVNFSA